MKIPSLFAVIPVLAMSAFPTLAAPPPTEKKPVVDEYHGVTVVDDYRWLEESDAPEVAAWTGAQLTTPYTKDTPSHGDVVARPGRLFALKFQPPKQQWLLVTLASAEDLASEKVVLDPNELEPKGQVAMDWFVPSPDATLIAVCLSAHGKPSSTTSRPAPGI